MPTNIPLSTLIKIAANVVDAEGEYDTGSSFSRIAVIDARIAIRIADIEGDPTIEIRFEDQVVLRVKGPKPDKMEVEVWNPCGEWQETLLEYGRSIQPRQNWTFGDGS